MVFLHHPKYSCNQSNGPKEETRESLAVILPRSGSGYFIINFVQVNLFWQGRLNFDLQSSCNLSYFLSLLHLVQNENLQIFVKVKRVEFFKDLVQCFPKNGSRTTNFLWLFSGNFFDPKHVIFDKICKAFLIKSYLKWSTA